MSACKWAGTERPRTIPGRHVQDCNGDDCSGCQECTEPHCVVCGITHADGSCAECLAEVRANLHEIGRLCGALPAEVEHRGIEGEAMMLLGPASDPEAWGHRQASARAGRIPADYLEESTDETHPLFVLGSWDMLYRDAFDHDDAFVVRLSGAIDYLDQNLTYASTWPHVPFEDFARDLRRCVAHLEAVLHDGEQVERSTVTCIEPECSAQLERVYAETADHDGWRCSARHCRSFYDHARYARAMHEHLSSEGADRWVKVGDALAVIPRPEMTLRTWIRNGDVRSQKDDLGHVRVWWPDVRQKHIESASRRRKGKSCA